MKKSRYRKLMERRRREQMRRDGSLKMPSNNRHKSKKDYDRKRAIRDDIDFGYDAEMIAGKIKSGAYSGDIIGPEFDW